MCLLLCLTRHERGPKPLIDHDIIICVIDTVGVEVSTHLDITEMTHVDVQLFDKFLESCSYFSCTRNFSSCLALSFLFILKDFKVFHMSIRYIPNVVNALQWLKFIIAKYRYHIYIFTTSK